MGRVFRSIKGPASSWSWLGHICFPRAPKFKVLISSCSRSLSNPTLKLGTVGGRGKLRMRKRRNMSKWWKAVSRLLLPGMVTHICCRRACLHSQPMCLRRPIYAQLLQARVIAATLWKTLRPASSQTLKQRLYTKEGPFRDSRTSHCNAL